MLQRLVCIFSLRKIGSEIALALCIRNILISYVLELVMLISHMEVIGLEEEWDEF